MGFGDFKLLAAIGAWTGWQVLPVVILVSAGAGRRVGGALALAVAAAARTPAFPSAPTSPWAGIVALLWGRAAVIAWLGYFPA